MKKNVKFLIKLTRAVEWWEYKLPVLLAVAYATSFVAEITLPRVVSQIGFYLLATVVSYTYVSLINDFTDMEEDAAVGKRTGMLVLSHPMRVSVLVLCIGAGIGIGFMMWPDILSLILFASTWIVFTLYSVRPFRWKARGILGVLCDATGVHLFPTLLMVTGVFNAKGIHVHYGWFATVGVWAFAYGLRGILAHQFVDRSNDIQTNTNTFASQVDPVQFRPIAMVIMVLELLAFGGMLVYIDQPVLLLLFPFYFALVAIRYRKFAQTLVSIIIPNDRPWQILMDDFYQIFFPTGLLVLAAVLQPLAWAILLIHILLFHKRGLKAIRDYFFAFKLVGSKLAKSMRSPV